MKKMLSTIVCLMLVGMMLMPAMSSKAENQAILGMREGVVKVVSEVEFKVGNETWTGSVAGTGFTIGSGNSSSAFLTNAHVVDPEMLAESISDELSDFYGISASPSSLKLRITDYYLLLFTDIEINFSLEQQSKENDWAICKLSQPINIRTFKLSDSDNYNTTSEIWALGFPAANESYTKIEDGGTLRYEASDVTITSGTIQKRDVSIGQKGPYFQHSAALNSGNSGGPLLDSNGYVIGINTYGDGTVNEFFYSLQINQVTKVLRTLNIPFDSATDGGQPLDQQTPTVAPQQTPDPGTQTQAPVPVQTAPVDDAETYEITFKADGDVIETVELKEGETLKRSAFPQAPEKDGYKFDGWTYQDGTDAEGTIEVDSNMTLLAKYTKESNSMLLWILIGGGVLLVGIIIVVIVVATGKKEPAANNTGSTVINSTNWGAPSVPQSPVRPVAPPQINGPMGGGYSGGGSDETTVLSSGDGYGETSLLSSGYLVRESSGEKIYITKQRFKLGRMRGAVDYCIKGNANISREHAVISNVGDGTYTIVDKRSSNHVYINGKEISPDTPIVLNDGDSVMLADEAFTFRTM